MTEKIPFNKWSKERIKQGRKLCTSRTRTWDDPRVKMVWYAPLGFVRDYLWQPEGADNPEEFERIWRSIFRGKFEENRIVNIHWGDFRE